MTLNISASHKISSLENHNYWIPHRKGLVRFSFSSWSNSLKMHCYYYFFFDLLKGFHWKQFVWKIITTVPVIVQNLSKAYFLEDSFFYVFLLSSVSGFNKWNFFLDNHNHRTRHSTEFVWSSFYSLRLYRCNLSFVSFLISLGGFMEITFFGQYCTRHSTDLIRC